VDSRIQFPGRVKTLLSVPHSELNLKSKTIDLSFHFDVIILGNPQLITNFHNILLCKGKVKSHLVPLYGTTTKLVLQGNFVLQCLV